jgi:hypothetical protein
MREEIMIQFRALKQHKQICYATPPPPNTHTHPHPPTPTNSVSSSFTHPLSHLQPSRHRAAAQGSRNAVWEKEEEEEEEEEEKEEEGMSRSRETCTTLAAHHAAE